MQKEAYNLESETNKILWEFERKTDPRIPARKSYVVLITTKEKKS